MHNFKGLLIHDYFCAQNPPKNTRTHNTSVFHIRQFNPRLVILSATVKYSDEVFQAWEEWGGLNSIQMKPSRGQTDSD